MEKMLQQEENKESERTEEGEQNIQNEEEGGIRRRLRDRNLLRKRRAEAEEKETNQLESQRKKLRAEYKRGTKKRGRPRKTDPAPLLSAVQVDAALTQEVPTVVVSPEPAGLVSDQLSSALKPVSAVEPQLVSFPTSAQVLESVQRPVFGPALISVNSAVNDPPAAQDPAPARAPDAVPAPDPFQEYIRAAAFTPPSAPQVETLYTKSREAEALEQVLIEDVGPDEEADISPSKDKDADRGLNEILSINVPEQNKMFSVPNLSSNPFPQEYFPGNSL